MVDYYNSFKKCISNAYYISDYNLCNEYTIMNETCSYHLLNYSKKYGVHIKGYSTKFCMHWFKNERSIAWILVSANVFGDKVNNKALF